jgi:hypothetical protein
MTRDSGANLSRGGVGGLMLVSSCLLLIFVTVLFFKVRGHDDGNFVYTLDDPYIHLAMGEQISHFHYGINPGEAASPSSSILWPFLLAPFASSSFELYVPLMLNVLFSFASVLLIAYAVGIWPPCAVRNWSQGWWMKLLTVLLLMFVANLVGLPFVGMEHSLQVFLSIVCAVGLASAWNGGGVPFWCLAAAAIGPLVRYESLAVTVGVALVLAATHHIGKAAAVLVAAVLPLLLFGFYLRHLGLPFLPTSVLIKGAQPAHATHLLAAVYEMLRLSYHTTRDSPDRWPLLALGVILACFAVTDRDKTHRIILAAGVSVAFLQIAIGPFGWFYRYEVYALIFVTLLFCRSVSDSIVTYGPFILGLFLLASPYLEGVNRIAEASGEVYRQQFQMRRFIDDFYRKDVAVNDIGLTSFRRAPGVRILDVWGLGSVEVFNATDKSASWLEAIVARHHVGLAIIYPQFFQIPLDWTPVGKMCDLNPVEIIGGRCVVFYATSPESVEEIRGDLVRFAPTLPKGVSLEFNPSRREGGLFIAQPK